jgi:hypothetical protein
VNPHLVLLAISSLALLLSLAALGVALFAVHQSGGTASTLARHRHGHTIRDGDPDPGAARSARAGGRPSEPTYGPPTTDLSAQPAAGPATQARPRLPRPGEIGRPRP